VVGLGKGERLRKNSEFANVRSRGRAWACELVVLKVVPNGLGWNRYGFVVGKRVGTAVVRNKVKRRLREIARLTPTEPGWDMVFIARPGASTASYRELSSAVARLLRKARVAVGVEEQGQ
jgi:ribonuclease P protein component